MKLLDKLTEAEIIEAVTQAVLLLSTHPEQELISKELREKLYIITQTRKRK